ncbi:MAG: methyltransferase domain-containing protein [Candidatus Heimdallarchaeota archaeon]|nr:methyltransferase domain-containing protein [Candidatus Heimdallarchaeota archaeon]MDH5646563.1 methyltransferase domain-containing protein [Candidatus Heimdallarchaeota archaeon]
MPFSFNSVARIYDIILPKRKPIEFLSILDPKIEDIVLEIGAGTGRIAKFYVDDVHELYLLDPAEKMLEKAMIKVPTAIPVIGFSDKMEFNDDKFDKIIGYDSLHHWQKQSKGLQEVYRVLKPGGKLVLDEVDPSNFRGKMVVIFEKILRMGSKFHSPEELTKLLTEIGFTQIKFEIIGKGMTYVISCEK